MLPPAYSGSDHHDDEERERGLRMGAMGALEPKPVKTKESLDETFTRIRSFVDPRTRRCWWFSRTRRAQQHRGAALAGKM